MPTQQQNKAQETYDSFIESFLSCQLATVDKQGQPNASYAPFASDQKKNFYVFISGLSKHTSNMFHNQKASLMLIEDESVAKNVFARARLTYQCKAELVERETGLFENGFNLLEVKFGPGIERMRAMPDFRLFKLTPQSGLFVIGFGQAFTIEEDLKTLKHLGGGNSQGHGKKNEL